MSEQACVCVLGVGEVNEILLGIFVMSQKSLSFSRLLFWWYTHTGGGKPNDGCIHQARAARDDEKKKRQIINLETQSATAAADSHRKSSFYTKHADLFGHRR